jgi:hypothetical protein
VKLLIQGEAYDLEEAIGEAAIGDLYVLKVKLGISIKTINNTFETMGELSRTEGFDAMDLLDNPDVMLNLQGLIWLAKRHSGAPFSLEDAGRVPFSALSFESDEEEAAVAEIDPKAQDSVAAEGKAE